MAKEQDSTQDQGRLIPINIKVRDWIRNVTVISHETTRKSHSFSFCFVFRLFVCF